MDSGDAGGRYSEYDAAFNHGNAGRYTEHDAAFNSSLGRSKRYLSQNAGGRSEGGGSVCNGIETTLL